ncbi:L,D-transpeptidase [Zavarzinia compransoris]|uniref:L,D-TPase catalytic domain-containing protein n=1 Tax=Zavarzinia compransoris TaxID=1264899 RepID=A0A317EBK1_9PROT|nr:L,D-transpeptidase [Zavarzinia compransoris]PWR23644.1 hypothetical protein DKG75_03500 [Zavarzinia compransoris]TDP47862.1 hypothetical protein DES42_102158 [Zavarzinia compransoris]
MRLTLLLLPALLTAIPAHAPVDLIRVDQGARTLSLIRAGTVVRDYEFLVGRGPEGPRDHAPATPRGRFTLDAKEPASAHALSLRLGSGDRAWTLGCIGVGGETIRELDALLPLGTAIDVVA